MIMDRLLRLPCDLKVDEYLRGWMDGLMVFRMDGWFFVVCANVFGGKALHFSVHHSAKSQVKSYKRALSCSDIPVLGENSWDWVKNLHKECLILQFHTNITTTKTWTRTAACSIYNLHWTREWPHSISEIKPQSCDVAVSFNRSRNPGEDLRVAPLIEPVLHFPFSS